MREGGGESRSSGDFLPKLKLEAAAADEEKSFEFLQFYCRQRRKRRRRQEREERELDTREGGTVPIFGEGRERKE